MATLDFEGKSGRDFDALDLQLAELIAIKSYAAIETSVLEWFARNPSQFSVAHHNTPQQAYVLTGWEAIYADIANRIAKQKPTTALGIDLTGHWEGDSPGFEVSLYDDTAFPFSATPLDHITQLASRYGAPWLGNFVSIDGPLRSPPNNALYQAIASYPHRHWGRGGGEVPHNYADYAAAVCLLYVRLCQSVEASLRTLGMPTPLVAIVGQNDFGPWFGTAFKVRQSDALRTAANSFEMARQAERSAELQSLIIKEIAEIRELYRLLHMFPFYRFVARRKFAEQLDWQLKVMCDGRGMPATAINSKMPKRAFERFTRAYVQSKNPSSIEDALNPQHTDSFHDSWVAIARKKNFELGQKAVSMFELNLGWALKFGGPILVDRWEHAKPYRADP